VARVFYQKQQALLKIIHDGYFGSVTGLVYAIEYQKCGLPHLHLLIFLQDQDKIHTVQQVDALISAQIPDENIHPQLHGGVTHFMLHGPCTPERCLQNGRCKKHFPKSFCEQTRMNDDDYPEYARPDNGHTVQKNENSFTNQHVVPYNQKLLVQFQCHMNIEVCASIKSIKYIHKYIHLQGSRSCHFGNSRT